MKGLGLLSVQKWAQNLRFSELGRNKWGFAGIDRSGNEELQESEAGWQNFAPCENSHGLRIFAGASKIRNPCQGLRKLSTLARGCENSQPLQILAFNLLKSAFLWLTTPAKQNITIKNQSTEV